MVAASVANMRQGSRTDLQHSAELPEVSQAQAAELLNVSERLTRDAKQVQTKGTPALIAAVNSGAVSVSAAADVGGVSDFSSVAHRYRAWGEIFIGAKFEVGVVAE